MMRFLKLVFFLSIVPSILVAQVIIREKVQIAPKGSSSLQRTTGGVSYFNPPLTINENGLPHLVLSSDITVGGVIDQDPSGFAAGWRVVMLLMVGYQEREIRAVGREPSGTTYSVTTPFSGAFSQGRVDIRMYLFDFAWGDAARTTSASGSNVEFTGALLHPQSSFPITGRAVLSGVPLPGVQFGGWEISPVDSILESGQSTRIDVGAMNADGWIYEPWTIPGAEAAATVRVTGGNYVYLQWIDVQGNEVKGKEIPISLVDGYGSFRPGPSCMLVFDNSQASFPGIEEDVVVTVEGGGKSKSRTVKLVSVPDHFEVRSARDTVAKGSVARLTVIAKDAGDRELQIDPNQQVTLWLSSGIIVSAAGTNRTRQQGVATDQMQQKIQSVRASATYGSFIVNDADTIPDYVTVRYGLARASGVQYLANGDIPSGSEPETITIRAEEADDPNIFGEALVVVRENAATLTLDIPTPKEIWPTLPAGSGGNPGKRNVKEQIKVTVTKSGVPAAGHEVEISAKIILPSGGHDHTNQPPRELLGELKDLRIGTRGKGLLKTTTDDNGEILLDYTAPEFSGTIELTAKSTKENAEDKDALTVKVPELILFAGTGSYELGGRTDSHPENHYFVSQEAIDSLISAANQFAKQEWNTSGTLRLNDMSLEWGGLFDLNNGWTNAQGHNSHRIGKSVDIENIAWETIDTVSQKTGKDTTFIIPKVKWVEQFVGFMETKMKNWEFVDEGQLRSDVFRRTRKYPHFEWKGR